MLLGVSLGDDHFLFVLAHCSILSDNSGVVDILEMMLSSLIPILITNLSYLGSLPLSEFLQADTSAMH
jgi:hypothetical protein